MFGIFCGELGITGIACSTEREECDIYPLLCFIGGALYYLRRSRSKRSVCFFHQQTQLGKRIWCFRDIRDFVRILAEM